MADNVVEIKVKVNQETGQLEVVGQKLADVGKKAGEAQSSFGKLGSEAKSLLTSFLPLATAGGIIAFFASAVKGAEEQNQAMRRLQFTLESTGQSWDKNKESVQGWAAAVQASTRFSDTQALQTLDKLTRVTGNLAQAQSASRLAMSLSVQSGRSLEETTRLVTDLLNKNDRALKEVNKEFGALANGATTAQGALDALQRNVGDAATKEESLTKATAQLSAAWSLFADDIGNKIAPGLTAIINFLKDKIVWIEKVSTGVAAMAAIWFEAMTGIARAWKSAFTFDWEGVKSAARDAMVGIEAIVLESATQQQAIDQAKTVAHVQESNERIKVVDRESEEELRRREEMAQKAEQISLELDQRMAALGQQSYQQKLGQLQAEVAARKAKINREVTDEMAKQKLLQKLNEFEFKSTQELAKLEVLVKKEAALQTMETAVQTLQVLNSMSERGTKSEINRAKAILALEKSIAIARILSSPQAALNPGLAAAQIALTVAQFGQQMQAIDQASAAFQQGQSEVSVTSSLPGGDELREVFGGPGGGGGGGGGGFDGGSPTFRANGGGGGGGNVINVGGIIVNFDVGQLSVDNVDIIMARMYEKVRQATVEGVQLAVAMRNLSERNQNLAV